MASCRRCSAPESGRRCRVGSRNRRATPAKRCCSCSTASGGSSCSPTGASSRCCRRWPASTLTTVAPTTTATALSSIATGLTPGEHGLIGYRMYVQGEVINVLRWVAAGGDRRRSLPPREVQPFAAFLGADVPVISPAELEHTAFTEAHLRGSRPVGYRAASAIAVEIGRQLARRGALRVRLLRGRRQDRPRTRLRRLLRRRAARRRPHRRRHPRRPRPRVDAARHRRPRPGRGRRPGDRARSGPARHGGAAIGRGTLPVVARVPRRGRRAAGRGDGPLRRRRVGGHPGADRRRRLVRRHGGAARCSGASATWRWWLATR